MRVQILAAALASASSLAWAQTAEPGAPAQSGVEATPTGQDAVGQVEEIVVTAERRAANLQDVPLAVSALTQSAIEAQGIRNVGDLAASVPNLTSTTGPQGSADANFFVRGVGQFDFIATNDPGVGVYVDGVYLGRTVGALLDSGDIGRVEVLRGPQGTLFGRNTLGGAVSVTSVAPELNEFTGRGRVTAGSRDRFEADLGVNAPLGERAALRLYGFSRYQDGFAENEITEARFGATERYGGKAQLLWKPAENVSVTLMGDYVDDSSNPAPSVLVDILPFPFFPAGAFTQTQDPEDFYRSRASNLPYSHNEIWGLSATINVDVGPRTFKSITAYRRLDSVSTSDPDGTLFRIYDQRSPTKQYQLSQEFQLSGATPNRVFEYLAGLYYFKESVQQTLSLCFAPLTPTPTAPFNPCNTWDQSNDQETNSYAVFGQARINLSNQFSVTLGGRYTTEEKENTTTQAFDLRPAGASPIAVFGFGLPVGIGDRVFLPFVNGLEGDLNFDAFTPKLGVEFKPNDDILVFANYSEGFRSGGFNGRLIAPQAFIPTYDPDETKAAELGLKADLFDRRLRFNATGFYTKYEGIQQTISDPAVQFRVANAGDAELYGVEAEVTAVPIQRLRLNAAVGYSHSEFQDVPLTVGDINGNALPFSPEWTVGAGVEYALDFGPVRATPRVDYRYQSRTYFTAFNNKFVGPGGPVPDDRVGEQQGPLGLWQARLTLTDADDRFSLAVFGDNLTDEKYYTFGQNALFAQGVSYLYLGRPREWGVTLGAKF